MKKLLFLFLIAFQTVVMSSQTVSAASLDEASTLSNESIQTKKIFRDKNRKAKKEREYPYNPYVELQIWDQLKPYFLPFKHSMRPLLDRIFQSERVTLSRDAFIAAGFELHSPKQPGNLVVGKHPKLKGYLVKAYLDTQDACEWHNYFRRVTGAQSIQQCIERHGFQQEFVVPKKWIYPLPMEPSPPNDPQYFRKNFVLVVEDMEILRSNQNKRSFRYKITPQILDHLFIILKEEGLIDSVFAGNIPFNEAGQINFVDTEHHHLWPIKYEMLTRYLSPEMQVYWQSLFVGK